jgi:hypothetical protein
MLTNSLPSRVRLDTTRTRVVGDTVWRRGASLPPGATRELEWRRVDAMTVEITWAGEAAGTQLFGRVVLESAVARAVGSRGATDAAAPLLDTVSTGVGAVRVSCPR